MTSVPLCIFRNSADVWQFVASVFSSSARPSAHVGTDARNDLEWLCQQLATKLKSVKQGFGVAFVYSVQDEMRVDLTPHESREDAEKYAYQLFGPHSFAARSRVPSQLLGKFLVENLGDTVGQLTHPLAIVRELDRIEASVVRFESTEDARVVVKNMALSAVRSVENGSKFAVLSYRRKTHLPGSAIETKPQAAHDDYDLGEIERLDKRDGWTVLSAEIVKLDR